MYINPDEDFNWIMCNKWGSEFVNELRSYVYSKTGITLTYEQVRYAHDNYFKTRAYLSNDPFYIPDTFEDEELKRKYYNYTVDESTDKDKMPRLIKMRSIFRGIFCGMSFYIIHRYVYKESPLLALLLMMVIVIVALITIFKEEEY